MKASFQSFAVFAVSMLIAGVCCGQVALSPKPTVSTRVFVGGWDVCPVNPLAKPNESAGAILVGALTTIGEKALHVGYDALADYLHDSVINESSAMTTLAKSAFFYRYRKTLEKSWTLEPAIDCVAIVRGRFGALDSRALRASANTFDPRSRFTKFDSNNVPSFPVLGKLGLVDFPDFYFELGIERDALNTSFRLQPRVAYYRQSRVKPSTEGKVDVNVVLVFSQPGSAIPLAVATLRIGGLQGGVDHTLESVNVENSWAPMLPGPAFGSIPPDVKRVSASLPLSPVNVTVTVEEAGTPGKFTAFLSRVLNNGKGEAERPTARAAVDHTAGPHSKTEKKQ